MEDVRPIAEMAATRSGRPRVSICCATFNHAPFIAEAIEGFLMQKTTFCVEILIHDDCSTDGTRAIVQRYADDHPELFRLTLPEENQYSRGVSVLQNLRATARGDYIAFCEGDDAWTDPLKLQRQVAFLDENPNCVIAGHDYVAVDEHGTVLSQAEHMRVLGANSMPSHGLSPLELRTGATIPRTCTRVFRNVRLDSPPEKDKVSGGDMFLSSILGQHGSYGHVPGIKPSHYRVHGDGVWNGLPIEVRQHEAQNTYFWMKVYYDRIGDQETARLLGDKHSRLIKRILRDRFLRRNASWLAPFMKVYRRLRAYTCR